MLMTELDPHRYELCVQIAAGRLSPDAVEIDGHPGGALRLGMHFESIGGEGVAFAMWVDAQQLVLWADSESWLQLVRGVLPAPSLDGIDAELLPVLAAWTIEPLDAYCRERDLGAIRLDEVATRSVEPDADVVLMLKNGTAALSLRVLEAPASFLRALAGSMLPVVAPQAVESILLPLCAGWARMRVRELASLSAGDCVVLDIATQVEAGEAWLYQDAPIARVTLQGAGQLEVLEIASAREHDTQPFAAAVTGKGNAMAEQANVSDSGANMELDISVMVIAEIARIPMKLGELRKLRSGSVISTEALTSSGVRLSVNGQQVGTGQLIQLGEKLAVRLD